MRTRILGKMLNTEVQEYLNRNDIIIVPVGTTEMHGGFPLDCETVISEAYCLRMGRNRGSEALLSCRIAVTMCNRICGFRLICKDYFMKSESIYKQMK